MGKIKKYNILFLVDDKKKDELENIFEDETIYDVIRALTYNDKSVLYLDYVKNR